MLTGSKQCTVGTTTDRTQVKQLAQAGFDAETDEDQHRAVLNSAAGNTAKAANQKIVANTPIILDGLKSITQNPSMANVAKQLNTMEKARYVVSLFLSCPGAVVVPSGKHEMQKLTLYFM